MEAEPRASSKAQFPLSPLPVQPAKPPDVAEEGDNDLDVLPRGLSQCTTLKGFYMYQNGAFFISDTPTCPLCIASSRFAIHCHHISGERLIKYVHMHSHIIYDENMCTHTHIFLCGCSEKWITQIKTYYVYIYICIPIHTYVYIYISLPVSFSVVAQRSEKPCSGDGSSGSGCSVWPFNFYWVWSECNLKSASDKYSQNSLGLPIRIMVVL